MPPLDNQRKAFDFLYERLQSQQPFTKEEFAAVTNWSESSFDTYWSKQFKPFVVALGGGRHRVSEAFRAYAIWDKFRQHVTQVRTVTASDYELHEYDDVLIFEFFMPLTNESALRKTLDALFFKDTILAKLRACETNELDQRFPREEGEEDSRYLERICEWISKTFVGYSINHVNGRFRAEALSTREEAVTIERAGNSRYLIDETTAVTRFIFPSDGAPERLRWFFDKLFIKSIIEVVNGEDEIWMVESGMRNALHIWRVAPSSC